ncbi:hypothetical protein BYT27DRAFT_7205781 [Phlegmacium glaucopus]|nr:hypothetical protein BYT27DRAFT_7205781 [Phlegmacium glaucopus]
MAWSDDKASYGTWSKHTGRNKTSQPICGKVQEKLHKNRALLINTMTSEVHRRLVKLNKI